jgi:peptidoglycan/LPS O-acetylase OafA/YrhL
VRPSSQERLVGIEGLRALAAAGVVIYHTGQVASRPGELGAGPLAIALVPFAAGVTLFFVLSGFLLYRPFATAVVRGEPFPSVRRYYRNRALRILPAYWFILAVAALVLQSTVVGFEPPNLISGALTDLGRLLKSVFLVQNYSPNSIGTGITPAWSLAIEVVFYLVLPLLAFAALVTQRRLRSHSLAHWSILAPVLIMLMLGVLGKILAVYAVPGPLNSFNAGWHSVLQFSFLGHADVFAWGMAVAVLKVLHDEGLAKLPGKRARLYAEGALVLVFAIAVLSLPAADRGWMVFFLPLPFALVLAFVVLSSRERGSQPLFTRVLVSRPLVAAGLVSYSVFLWNHPLLYWLHAHGLVWYGPVGFVATLALLCLLCGVLSALTYRFVESPALRLKLGFSRPERPRREPKPTGGPAPDPAAAGSGRGV